MSLRKLSTPKDDHPYSTASLNIGFAISYLMLAAHANGLRTVIIGYVIEAIGRKSRIAKNLGISNEEYGLYVVVILGYPLYDYSRIPLRNSILHYLV